MIPSGSLGHCRSIVKSSVRVATISNITLSGTQTIDGVALSVGNRVLVKNQGDQTANGIYDVQSGAWVRSSDANTSQAINSGMQVYVQEGTNYAGEIWILSTVDPITLGVTNTTFDATGLMLTNIVKSLEFVSPLQSVLSAAFAPSIHTSSSAVL